MGRYICVRAEYAEKQPLLEVLRAALRAETFHVRGLAAVDYLDSSVFLSGFGLEDFVTERTPVAVSSIVIDHSIKDSEYLSYMNRLSEWIRGRHRPAKELSLHERVDSNYNATFLHAPHLLESSLSVCNHWASRRSDVGIYVYGTFSLSVGDSVPQDWSTAYRFLFDEGYPVLAAPFVTLDISTAVRRYKPKSAMAVTLFTESTVWLHNSIALNGHINNASADANLANLVRLTEVLLTPNVKPYETTLSVESETFRRDFERIERAFSHLL